MTGAAGQGHVPQLDGLRGCAMLLVILSHLVNGVFPQERPAFLDGAWRTGAGIVGVQLFLLLSGFLLTTMLQRETRDGAGLDLGGFLSRRLRRLAPPLAAACAVHLAAAAWIGDVIPALGAVARTLTFTSNLGIAWARVPNSGWLNHSWNLSLVVQFYVFWALCHCLPRAAHRRVLPVIAIAVILFNTIASMSHPPVSLMRELLRWDALMAGSLLALGMPRLPSWSAWSGGIVLFALCVFPPQHGWPGSYALATIGCVLVVPWAPRLGWLASPSLGAFGRASLSVYLWHLLGMRLPLHPWLGLLAGLGLAWASARWLEQPARRPAASAVPAPVANGLPAAP